MKYLICVIIVLYSFSIQGCPACVARVQKNSPPFFSPEFYEFPEFDNELDMIITGSGR